MNIKKILTTLAITLVAAGAFASDQSGKPGTTPNQPGPQMPIPFKLKKVWPNPSPSAPGYTFKILVEADKSNVAAPCSMSVSLDGGAFAPLGTADNFTFFSPSSNYHFDTIGDHYIKVKADPGSNCTGEVTGVVNIPPQCPKNWTGTANADGTIACHPLIPGNHPVCPPKTEFFQTICSMGCKQIIY